MDKARGDGVSVRGASTLDLSIPFSMMLRMQISHVSSTTPNRTEFN
jgi:hypothetical protein